MAPLHIDPARSPDGIRDGLQALLAALPERFGDASARAVSFVPTDDAAAPGWAASADDDTSPITVSYRLPAHAFRALGQLLGGVAVGGAARPAETARFDMVGIMLDVSRNAVIRPDAFRQLLCRLALMGYTAAMLYAEDTYEVPGEPFFGYLRGAYTAAELRELDAYAGALGIEMFPCIQTLAHMEQILQWPAYAELGDTDKVLLADHEPTYELIERLVAAAAAPFRSRRIHLGMDEAHGIGGGRYRQQHGEARPFDILNRHLDRVLGMTRTMGLKPMIWSDMYFRLGSATDDYYDPSCTIPDDVVAAIPKDVQLVYWDYYHRDEAFYSDWIERHRALGSMPVVAGGVWIWGRLWCHLPFTIATTDPCMAAAKKHGVREVFATLWGDDGGECDVFSALPGLQYFAEHCYQDRAEAERVAVGFRGSCDADWQAWAVAGSLDAPPGIEVRGNSAPNVSKLLLWQDPLLAIVDPQTEGLSLSDYYAELSRQLHAAVEAGSGELLLPALVAEAVALKCDLRRRLAAAYTAGDREALRGVLAGDLSRLRKVVDQLWHCHRDRWLQVYKPFGLEVVEARYGALRTRLESVAVRLDRYLSMEPTAAADADAFPELAAPLQRIYEPSAAVPGLRYDRLSTPSYIK